MALAVENNYRSRRSIFFVEKILEPLSHDLKTKEFRGYRFPVENLPAFFRRHSADVQSVLDRFPALRGVRVPNPNEICMAWHYARAFWVIYSGRPSEAYSGMINCHQSIFTTLLLPTHLLRRRPINEEQRRFNIRRFIIIRHFWNHQRRRENGDMTVGEIILPWVEVRDEWFESGDTSYERTTENANEE